MCSKNRYDVYQGILSDNEIARFTEIVEFRVGRDNPQTVIMERGYLLLLQRFYPKDKFQLNNGYLTIHTKRPCGQAETPFVSRIIQSLRFFEESGRADKYCPTVRFKNHNKTDLRVDNLHLETVGECLAKGTRPGRTGYVAGWLTQIRLMAILAGKDPDEAVLERSKSSDGSDDVANDNLQIGNIDGGEEDAA